MALSRDNPLAHQHTADELHLVEGVRARSTLAAMVERPASSEWRHQHVVDLLLAYGRLFTASSASTPEWLGEQGRCWRNATQYAEDYPQDVVYVEGLAVHAGGAVFGLDTPHAWCASGSTAIDPSPGWHDDTPAYLGVPFTHEFRRHIQRRDGADGLLWSTAALDFLRHGLPDDAVVLDVGRPLPAAVEQ